CSSKSGEGIDEILEAIVDPIRMEGEPTGRKSKGKVEERGSIVQPALSRSLADTVCLEDVDSEDEKTTLNPPPPSPRGVGMGVTLLGRTFVWHDGFSVLRKGERAERKEKV